jgi:hypothetical protein
LKIVVSRLYGLIILDIIKTHHLGVFPCRHRYSLLSSFNATNFIPSRALLYQNATGCFLFVHQKRGARVPLILDRTEWGAFNLLYASVGWRGRALPLVWQVIGPGASSFAEQKELLQVVVGWLPKGAQVMLLGDREFGTGVLAKFALEQGWGVCLRLKVDEYVRRQPKTTPE